MTANLINQTPNGPVPSMPSVEDILGRLGGGKGWDAVLASAAAQPMADTAKEKREALEQDYADCFSTPAGRRVLEDLFDQTFRRSSSPPERVSLEADALYNRERLGQNSTAYYICTQIHKGRKPKPAPKAKPKKKA